MQAPFNRLPLTGILASACLLPLQACSMSYRAEPIEAWVVDADTGQPINGVIVTANWQLEYGTLGGNVPAGQLMVMETVSDLDGRIYFPAWGPKTVTQIFSNPLKSGPGIIDKDPHLLLFKPGYRWLGLENNLRTDFNRGSLRKSDWNGKTIKMQKFAGSPAEYANDLGFLGRALDFARSPSLRADPCNLKKVARMVMAVHLQGKDFERRGVQHTLFSLDYYLNDPNYKDECGVRDALRKQLP